METNTLCRHAILSLAIALVALVGCEQNVELPTATDTTTKQVLRKDPLPIFLTSLPDIIVNTTSDAADFGGAQQVVDLPGPDGVVSLREAIVAANNTAGPQIIGFSIPLDDLSFDGTVFTIKPALPLPLLSGGETIINGATQTSSWGNTNSAGPEVVINGGLIDGADGLIIASSDNVVHSLVVNGFANANASAISIRYPGNCRNIVSGCFVGTDATGTAIVSNGAGVDVGQEASSNQIGGVEMWARNVISGNGFCGVRIQSGAHDNVVQGNFIGTDVTGTHALPNGGIGVFVHATAGGNNIVGGEFPSARNVISGNGFDGIVFSGSSNLAQGNFVGTDVTGTIAIGNGNWGVTIHNEGTVYGNENRVIDNVISGNKSSGIFLATSRNTIQGNFIGTDVSGTITIGNGQDGIRAAGQGENVCDNNMITENIISGSAFSGIAFYSANENLLYGNFILANTMAGIEMGGDGNRIGGNGALEGNVIRGNGAGVSLAYAHGNFVEGNTISNNTGRGVRIIFESLDNTVSRNSIFSNGRLGIDLGGNGVTLNDQGDIDAGQNNLMNFPVLTSAKAATGKLIVHGTIDTPNPRTVTLEFFANAVPYPGGDPSGHGEGAVYLGSDRPNPLGKFTATLPSVAAGTLITATATDADGNTSEFASNIVAKAPGN